ncbi:MAG: alpha-ketoacid dehydrogenase subunit beta [Geminicoccaceae bacterium]|nr:alpha-ketoacid dehydrogenase subunit beta [Geminicoccaceae bacterium]MDW8124870.1 alpha-ketoacid dehydrogenase subunit beta [Geminicoccaceae bacterium]MDW8342389.1 alpha-ketoacid dehydrogenase subunit beta [Geminicoccaceae bacterium]
MARKRMIQAMNEALHEEMERDPSIVLFGEDVKASLFGDTKGLWKRFGPERVRDTPICETLIAGMAVGAAAAGRRVICHMMFGNFVYTGMDAIANQAAKLRFMTNGQIKLPITFIAVSGGGRSAAAQHSDAIHPVLANLGGIKVVMPSSPADAKGLLKAAIRDDDPVFFLQAAGRGGEPGEVPADEYLVPLGEACVRRPGRDVTVVAIGSMVRPALKCAEALEGEGIEVEVIDPRTIVPLDLDTILGSVRKTGRLVVVDEARDTCSFASHIAALAAEHAFDALRAPIRRVTVPDCAIPFAPVLERAVLPSVERIEEAIRRTLEHGGRS